MVMMILSKSTAILFVGAIFIVRTAADGYFFNGTDFTSQVANISSACAIAMQSSLDCDPYLTYVMTSDYWGSLHNDTLQDQFCDSTCGQQLNSYISSVKTACANDPQPLPGYPATYWGDSALAAWNQMCLKDSSTGQYCSEYIEDLFANSADASPNDSDWPTTIPSDQLCSNCVIGLFRHLQSTPYSNYDDNLASEWASIQSQCKLSYPTAVPSLQTNLTQPGGFAAPGSAKTGCISGIQYSVVSGDNCETICEKKNCATGTLIAINDLYTDCSNLLAGASICIPPQCTTYNVQGGDTCDKIASTTGNTFQQLVAWNPSIGAFCSNLLSGQNICVSPPGGVQTLTTIAGATVTQTAVYADATVSPPASIARGTSKKCGKYYQVQSGDTCELLALNQTIALGLFEAINPAINADCTNLELGLSYCVRPTADWNSTASSTIVTAATTTPSGTTSNCYEYYTIQSGDYCGKVGDLFDISMVQLQYWNPSLLADCSNLALGEAYCVHGTDQPPTDNDPASTAPGAKFKRGKLDGGGSRGAAAMPERTRAPEGGVPAGWPGLNAPRLQRGVGNTKGEL